MYNNFFDECSDQFVVPGGRPKQQISVPFLWEDKPGMPKKEWDDHTPTLLSPITQRISPVAPSLASIPFEWEERPGLPLPRYNNPFVSSREEGEILGSYLDTFKYNQETELNITSEKKVVGEKLKGNCGSNEGEYMSFIEFYPNDIPLAKVNAEEGSEASSVDLGARSSSSEEGEDGENGVIEFFFPLSTPDYGFVRKACFIEHEDIGVDYGSDFKRRTHTLEELMLLSRKLSCRRNNTSNNENGYHHNNSSMDFMKKKKLMTCF